jgi:hypothetical protein
MRTSRPFTAASVKAWHLHVRMEGAQDGKTTCGLGPDACASEGKQILAALAHKTACIEIS